MKALLKHIVAHAEFHAAWLNSLSFMENTGARKISAAESSRDVTLMVLKHAAEEARHAYYLKRQIIKTGIPGFETYSSKALLAPVESYTYLNGLDIAISRYLKTNLSLEDSQLRFAAYLLVTYAIEVRADLLYPVYQEALTEAASLVNVKSIIAEEEGHLEEMIGQLKEFSPVWEVHAEYACAVEQKLFDRWIKGLAKHTGFMEQPVL